MTRIRTRLIVAFVIVALLPAIPLTILVRSLLERSFEPPFEDEVTSALDAGLTESRERLRLEKEFFVQDLERRLAPEIRIGLLGSTADPGKWTLEQGDGGVVLVLPSRPDSLTALPTGKIERWGAVQRDALASGTVTAQAGIVGPERVDDLLVAGIVDPSGKVYVVARALPERMTERAATMVETIGLLQAFRVDRMAVLRGYVGPFLVSYALLLAVAIVAGSLLAARVARPVEALARASGRVGSGDLATRVDVRASGEVGHLVSEFNRMVADLAAQRDEVSRLERLAAWRDLARSLAHEIKNPLTPIQLAVQQLGDRFESSGTEADDRYRALLEECVEIVNEEVAALRRLVKEFSEFARLPVPVPEWGDLGATITEIARLYGSERMSWDVDGKIRTRFDESELRRALINLVDNGLAACLSAGRAEMVELGARLEGEWAVVRVSDRGTGIAPENLARIFEPNFTTKSGGMGLGLAIVDGIVRGHGGTIDVKSEIDRGTTFRIRLPVAGPKSSSEGERA
jgi:nitrogen fixation/metabolism regulation signal transduction histidine kinase